MNIENVPLGEVRLNEANPRSITKESFAQLVESILVFPKMLHLRPIAVDAQGVALGGNMRLRALLDIASTPIDEITERLQRLKTFQKKTEYERQELINYWEKWIKNPTAIVVKASELSEDEKSEFIIKDNLSFGQWDFDLLANEWDERLLSEWGLDIDLFGDDGEPEEKEDNPMGIFPLSIVLNAREYKDFQLYKKERGFRSDTEAFKELFNAKQSINE